MPTGKKQTNDHKGDHKKQAAGSEQKQAKSASGSGSSSTKTPEKSGKGH